eukprot:352528-Chlamydomonas_euryale.AAC.3
MQVSQAGLSVAAALPSSCPAAAGPRAAMHAGAMATSNPVGYMPSCKPLCAPSVNNTCRQNSSNLIAIMQA